MVCYIFPTLAAVLVHAQRKIGRKRDEPGRWLSHLLFGGAIFGIVDHWWNGQLALFGPDVGRDLLLGGLITVSIYAFWYGMMALSFASRARGAAAGASAQG